MRFFPGRLYDPSNVARFHFWRWIDIRGRDSRDREVYISRLLIFRCPCFSVMVNRFRRPDPDRHEHDHPWSFVSFILVGSYIERRSNLKRRCRWVNVARAEDKHRVTWVSPRCTTLVVTGPKRRSWGFYTEGGFVGWREYLGVDS